MSGGVFDQSDEFFQQTFSHVAIPEMSLRAKEFEECRFDSCSFPKTAFSGCVFRDACFVACDFTMATVVNTRFVDVTFKECKLIGVNWTVAQLSSVGTPLTFEEQCILDYSVFSGLGLKNLALRDSLAREVDFTDADLSGSDFSGSDLSGARFARTNLSHARLEAAFGYSIDVTANTLTGTRVSLPEAGSLLQLLGIEVVDR